MSTHKIFVEWTGEGETFVGHNPTGPTVAIDGNRVEGTSPMVLLLHAEAGCTGIDVVSLLEKMRQPITGLRIEVTGEKGEGDYPRIWEKIHLRYLISGAVAPDKAEKAVALSMETYCSVSAMLSKAAEVTYEIALQPD
jgi:putative redox protein